MYRPLSATPQARESAVTTLMAKGGEDLRDPPQLLNTQFALKILNYIVTTDGALIKRKGLDRIFEVAGNKPITLASKWLDDYWVYAYDNKLAVYRKSTGASTVVKTYTNARNVEGEPYGDYFYATNGDEKPGHISIRLDYTVKTVNFTNGAILTGATSGATAVVIEGGGVATFLILGNVSGTFQNGELITDSSGGSATCSGTQYFTYRAISNAPVARTLTIQFSRLVLGNLVASDRSAVAYSNIDIGTLGIPPFENWTVGTNSVDPGQLNYKRAGGVNRITSLGQFIVVFSDNGKWAFSIDTYESAGSLKKKDTVIFDRTDFGGSRAVLNCAKGLFYANEAGLWQLVSIGQPNIPYSDQEGLNSVLLGTNYFDDVDLANADIAYEAKMNMILLTCAKDSNTNNEVITYNLENKAITRFSGWNINRFLNENQTLYGASSQETKVWQLFKGYDDDGTDVWTEYYQELKTGDLYTRQSLLHQWVQGFLSLDTALEISFDVYDTKGVFKYKKIQREWTVQSGSNLSDDYGVASWGTASWGGDVDLANMVECFDGGSARIGNYQRIRLRITGHDQVPHAITWVSLETKSKKSIRRRKLATITS